MRWSFLVVGVLVSKVLTACGSDSSARASGTCPNLAGEWSLSGTCQSSSCTVSQNQCNFTAECSDGTTMTGKASSTSVALSGNGVRCSGKLEPGSPPHFTGTCESPGGQCTVAGSCEPGACARASQPGQDGGIGGGGGEMVGAGGKPIGAGGSTGSGGRPVGAGGIIVGAGGIIVGAGGIVIGAG